jgi:biotin carboxyl carrier protein
MKSSRNRISVAAVGLAVAAMTLGPVALQAENKNEAADKKVEKATAKSVPSGSAKKGNAKIRENSYYYSAFNRRDPFASLISGVFVSEKKMDPVELGRVELVGIVKGELDRFALLEDEKGFSYIVRVGDRVKNGSVVAIGDETMIARITNFGQTRKFTLRLAKRNEGDKR